MGAAGLPLAGLPLEPSITPHMKNDTILNYRKNRFHLKNMVRKFCATCTIRHPCYDNSKFLMKWDKIFKKKDFVKNLFVKKT